MLHVCLICQSFLLQKQLLCEFCRRKFSDRVRAHGPIVRHRPIFTQSLWSWDSETEEISRAMIYGLKGCGDEKKWMWMATLLMDMTLRTHHGSCLVPIPSKTGNDDHAMGLTKALSRLSGYPIENCLRPEEGGHQRERNRVERREIRFAKARRLRKRYANFIVVDDVVTSGATLQAAFKALKEPELIQGLCFIDRRLVADFDEPCYKQRQ